MERLPYLSGGLAHLAADGGGWVDRSALVEDRVLEDRVQSLANPLARFGTVSPLCARARSWGLTSISADSSAGGSIVSMGAFQSSGGRWFSRLRIQVAACFGARLGSITRW